MAMLIEVEYPGGERAITTGYYGGVLVVQIVPRGPEAALGDELEVDFGHQTPRVLRIVGGPRRPTIHVRLTDASEAAREQWMDARDAEGWLTRDDADDPGLIYVVATRDGLDPAALTP
jgi:hypothetical protein